MRNASTEHSLESNVNYYYKIFPAIFSKAKGSYLYDIAGKKYLDFFSGAGALNYGHNNLIFKRKLISYIESDMITHSLDMMSEIKLSLINNFQNLILKKRNLNYKIQFTGPTGTDAVEAAIKLARKYSGRKNIVYFSNSYHGMSMGSLSISSKKNRIGVPVGYSVEMPFYKKNSDSNFALESYLKTLKKEEYPAAIILETIQAEGGINVATVKWLKYVAKIANKYGILLIVDDIQVGVGRSGNFFSFERAKINPDIVCLSKSISGYGLPLALLLIKPHIDVWESGEHAGTFRGNNLAFVTANEAILRYWKNDNFTKKIKSLSDLFCKELLKIIKPKSFSLYGLGFIYGIDTHNPEYAAEIRKKAFDNGLIFETCGPSKSVIKMIPPLTITAKELKKGLDIFAKSISCTKPIST